MSKPGTTTHGAARRLARGGQSVGAGGCNSRRSAAFIGGRYKEVPVGGLRACRHLFQMLGTEGGLPEDWGQGGCFSYQSGILMKLASVLEGLVVWAAQRHELLSTWG